MGGGGGLDHAADRASPICLPSMISTLHQVDTLELGQMDAMLDNFLVWQGKVAAACRDAGHWCDAVDPRSGFPLAGGRLNRWNEVGAMQELLGLRVVRQDSACPVLCHPTLGEL